MDAGVEFAIKFIARAENIENYVYETSCCSSKNDFINRTATITNLEISNKDKTKTLHCILKRANKDQVYRLNIPVASAFEREIHVYCYVYPTLKTFVSEKRRFPTEFEPKFYYAISTEKCEAIILENLKEIGYRLHPNNFTMNDDHVRLVLQKYAHFHATSLALSSQNRSKFCYVSQRLADLYTVFTRTKVKRHILILFEECVSVLDEEEEEWVIRAFRYFIRGLDAFFEELLDLWNNKHCLIIHGDAWNNNLLFKYEDLNLPNKPTSVRVLNHQLVRLGLPVIDIAQFIYSCSSKEVINSLDEYLDFYYKTFSEHLASLGSASIRLYPYKTFKTHWKKYAKFTFLVTPLILKVSTNHKEFVESSPTDSDAACASIYKDDFFKDRIKFLLLHFANKHYF